MHPVTDSMLAARIEREAAAAQREYAEAHARLFPEHAAMWAEIGGGVAAVLEPGSPANGALGVAIPAEITAEEFARLARFFADRGETPSVSACPFAHPSLSRHIDEAGWMASGSEHVFVRELDLAETQQPPADGVEVHVARTPAELKVWAGLVASGFSAPRDPTPPEMRLASAAAACTGRICLIATVDGVPAGTGELRLGGGIGWLSADTTQPHFRRRGVQGSLQRARIELARDAGCELAVSEALPGSASQRNMERLGFRIVYTRVEARGPDRSQEGTAR